ncbi:hypothetical protein [Janthinobacterium sp. PAMC25594]|jgi:hypothetical protein|uniref:hypothetical protein n=1 Tax=Janthinobacterium sp. PAMC25594 TaxID=2861284 RepID=UPI001C633C57|nr:hypothetical protein [Janthinobacterium sp. PAMC25594]QYG07568.1 hypothetical protein KY494_01670 [Janthinobacterium sp. PAMC25594]
MTVTTTLKGNIVIGTSTDPTKNISIPIETQLPPAKAQEFEFKYGPQAPQDAITIVVGDFITWAATAVGLTVTDADLPTSLKTLSVAVTQLDMNTNGNLTLATSLGSVDADKKWKDDWTPIAGIAISLQGVALSIVRTPA